MVDENHPSKTQRKKQVQALQDLGAELVALSAEQLAAIELPETLRDAVMDARRIKTFEARRRQLQYIGKIMRRVDPEPIRAVLDAYQAPSRSRNLLHKRVEAWRERLLAGDAALAELAAEYPGADATHLRSLVRSALREQSAGQPPRSYRALYQALRAILSRLCTPPK